MAGASTALQIFGTMMTVKSSLDTAAAQDRAASEAERMGRENAANIEAETRESARRAGLEMTAKESAARARAAASGVAFEEGSMGEVMTGMKVEHGRQLDWMQESGRRQAGLAVAGGASAGATGRAQASATRGSAVASTFKSAPSIYTSGKTAGWWGGKK